MTDTIKNLSITRLSVPMVMVISLIMFFIGTVSSAVFQAGTKAAQIEDIAAKQNSMYLDFRSMAVDISTLKENSGITTYKLDRMGKDLDDMKNKQEILDQKMNTISARGR